MSDSTFRPRKITPSDLPPAAGHTLTWSGQFYFRCRFDHDEAEFEQFMSNFWSANRIEFTSVKP
jgi:hypothetical protein